MTYLYTNYFKKYLFLSLILISHALEADSFNYNSYNNHGIVGLINMPTARIFNESVHGISLYDGNPDQKITLTSNPFNWLEASFFYTNIEKIELCRGNQFNQTFCQGYKDKGFNFKIRIKEEGILPAVAIGINDIAGTGFYSSEYIVASYGIKNLDLHFGLAWGSLNGSEDSIKNPFGYLSNSFKDRPSGYEDLGGQFQKSRYFSSEEISPFYGFSYFVNSNLLLKFEKDTTLTPGFVGYSETHNEYSYGFEYFINNNFSIGLAKERDDYLSVKFSYKNNPLKSHKKYAYKRANNNNEGDKYRKLIKNIENNGIGVNKIIETSESIGLELTQFTHSNIDTIEEIILSASKDSGISKEIKSELRIANLKVVSEYDSEFIDTAEIIYQKNKKKRGFNFNNSIRLKPFLASREEFFKGSLLLENDAEYIFTDSFFFSSNLKYSLADNFDDLTIPPVDTYPAQVRSDVKDYLQNIDEGIIIGRAQFDYHITPKDNHHLMFTAGILEEMFAGVGF